MIAVAPLARLWSSKSCSATQISNPQNDCCERMLKSIYPCFGFTTLQECSFLCLFACLFVCISWLSCLQRKPTLTVVTFCVEFAFCQRVSKPRWCLMMMMTCWWWWWWSLTDGASWIQAVDRFLFHRANIMS